MKRRSIAAALLCLAAAAEPQPLPKGSMLTGRFVQTRHLAGFDKPLISEGKFTLIPDRRLSWIAEKPFAVDTEITPQGLEQRVDGDQTLQLDAAQMPMLSRLAALLTGALSGDWSQLDHDFAVSHSTDAAGWHVVLIPPTSAGLRAPFTRIVVDGSQFVQHVVLTRTGGDYDELDFRDQQVGPSP